LRIKITLDSESIDNAIKKIDRYKNSLQKKAEEVLSQLAVMGMEVVNYAYGDEEYEISCIVNGNNAMIIAEGSEVVFLEFGTGVYTEDHTYEMETEGLPPIFAGSYSQTEGSGQFRAGHEYWYYNHRKYVGSIPLRGFYMASKEIKEQAVNVAIKVFKK